MLEIQVEGHEIFVRYRPPSAGPNEVGYLGRVVPGGSFHGVSFDQLRVLGSGRHEVVVDERMRSERGPELTWSSEWDRRYAKFRFALFGYGVGAYTSLELLTIAREVVLAEAGIRSVPIGCAEDQLAPTA